MTRFRDFQVKNYKNPFFTRQKKTRIKFIVILVCIFAVLAALIYAIVYSPISKISSIEVTGAKTIDPNKIKDIVRKDISGMDHGFLPEDNIENINTDRIKNSLLNAGLPLRTVDVIVNFKKITIEVSELEASMRVVGASQSYILDQEGRVMKIADPGEGDNLIAVSFSDPTKTFSVGDVALDQAQMQFIMQLHKYFATQAGINDKLITVDQPNYAMNVITSEGWYAIFDPDIDLGEQLKSLASVLVSKFNPDARKDLLYIDARFGDRVFYKTK
jgi:hypothetical protein